MKKAIPVWAEGREKEMNLTLCFRGIFQTKNNQDYQLKITASTLYRVSLNGVFIGYGPARTAQGFFRVDKYDLGKQVRNGENILAIEVAGYNVNSYYILDQPSFLQAEIDSEGKVVLATGTDGSFKAFQPDQRLQKVERYSFQRPFTEYYRLKKDYDQWKTSAKVTVESLKQAIQPTVKLLPRNLLLPEYKKVHPRMVYSQGTIKFQKPEKYKKDRSLTQISEKLKGYKESELEVLPSQFMQEITNNSQDTLAKPYVGNKISLVENEFATFDFGTNLSGFIGGKISCSEPSTVVFYFDEMLTDGDVKTKKRMPDVNNQVVYELEPGVYNLETFESYTFKYLKTIVLKGKCQLLDVYLREYAFPENPKATFNSSNNKLNEIYKAARQSFRQNTVDIFMDCPSRERAGWLCDSYFMAIMEKDLTGYSAVAHNFYENYALPEKFEFLPEGMLPMCYPADHNDGVFIPNWAMWFIIQIDDYAHRGGDPVLVAQLKPRIEKLLDYFAKFENKDGLLEKLDSWIFVEWSKANSFVQDVNYPTNMLYSEALLKAAELYHNDAWLKKAELIKKTVLKQSFNGTFFVDNAVRDGDGKLQITNNTTEVCQYYAFFFNLATPDTHPDLWKKLITEFGPNRKVAVTYPLVFKANAFIGNYIRMDILSRYGLQSQLLKEIQEYFYYMAKRTGTLWENTDSHASCNHGFASYIGHVLCRDVLGISQIDYISKEVTVRFSDVELDQCSGAIPVGDNAVELWWKRSDNLIRYSVKTPSGYKVKIENSSSSKLQLIGRPTDQKNTEEKSIPLTGVSFKTSDLILQKVYDEAEKKAKWNIADFGKYKVLVEGAGYNNIWLETQPMGGYMYGKRDLEVGRNNIQIFIDFQREDGRYPGMLSYRNGELTPHYGWFQGYCFPMPAFELYFWLNKDKEYLSRLYSSLEKFDGYLWKTRDSDQDGCLETWCIWDTGEDACVRFNGAQCSWPYDYAPSGEAIRKLPEEKQKEIAINKKNIAKIDAFPLPIESMDIMSYSYSGRDVLAKISKELGNGKEAYWRGKADEVRAKLKSYLWDEKKHACYDRDKNNKVMDILLHNNLRCMYFGIFDQQMADDFVKYHLMNPKEFWTPMPLPSIAANDPAFRNIPGNNWSGQPQGLTYQRSISAMENYGHYAELTMIGEKFLKVIGDSLKFTQQFDAFKGTVNNTSDGYGPSILASLEFISRMYGIHLTQDKVYWSCLETANQFEYSQVWGKHKFSMMTRDNQVFCSIDGKEIFSFTKGIRVVTDVNGKLIEAIGIETKKQKAAITFDKKTFSFSMAPNAVYQFEKKIRLISSVEFSKPAK